MLDIFLLNFLNQCKMKLKLISFQSKPPVNEKKLGPTIPDHIREQMEKSQDNQEDDSIPAVQMSAVDPSEDEVDAAEHERKNGVNKSNDE